MIPHVENMFCYFQFAFYSYMALFDWMRLAWMSFPVTARSITAAELEAFAGAQTFVSALLKQPHNLTAILDTWSPQAYDCWSIVLFLFPMNLVSMLARLVYDLLFYYYYGFVKMLTDVLVHAFQRGDGARVKCWRGVLDFLERWQAVRGAPHVLMVVRIDRTVYP